MAVETDFVEAALRFLRNGEIDPKKIKPLEPGNHIHMAELIIPKRTPDTRIIELRRKGH